jgi:hypothetical protein
MTRTNNAKREKEENGREGGGGERRTRRGGGYHHTAHAHLFVTHPQPVRGKIEGGESEKAEREKEIEREKGEKVHMKRRRKQSFRFCPE